MENLLSYSLLHMNLMYMKPFVGQIFDSLKAVEDFYRSYAKAACFCIGDILPAAYLKL
jgi:hypothetical protein